MTDAEQQLAGFMAKYDESIGELARAIRARLRALYPTALELVYDNYNALAIGFGPTEKTSEAIFSIALFPRWVSLFFLQGAGLPDPQKLLKGSGKVAKHVVLPSPDMLDQPGLRTLMAEAVARAVRPFPEKGKHELVIKSVSARQRPRRPAGSLKTSPGGAKATGTRRRVSARG